MLYADVRPAMFFYNLLLSLMSVAILFAMTHVLNVFGVYLTTSPDPANLTVSQLKAILDWRALRSYYALEKSELVELVLQSGSINNLERTLLEQLTEAAAGQERVFKSEKQYYRLVETFKGDNSSWIVRVKPSDFSEDRTESRRRVDEYWAVLRNEMEGHGLRTGVLDCSVVPEWCQGRRWRKAGLLLALPQDHKKRVSIYEYRGEFYEQNIKTWISETLRRKLVYIKDLQEFEYKWINYNSTGTGKQHHVRIVLVTRRDTVPIQFFAYGLMRLDGVDFGILNHSHGPLAEWVQEKGWLWWPDLSRPLLLIITRDWPYVYGQNIGECFAASCLQEFLTPWRPTLAHVVYVFYTLALLSALLDVFIVDGFIEGLRSVFWSALRNTSVFTVLLWCVLDRVKLVSIEDCIHSITDFSALEVIRKDVAFLRQNPHVFLVLCVLTCCLLTLVTRDLRSLQQEEPISHVAAVNLENECVICLLEMSHGQQLSTMRCGHTFHEPCLQRWRRNGHSTCPVCRLRF